jgi:hypothetical protein
MTFDDTSGRRKGPFVLDEQVTNGITAFLASPGTISGKPALSQG